MGYTGYLTPVYTVFLCGFKLTGDQSQRSAVCLYHPD